MRQKHKIIAILAVFICLVGVSYLYYNYQTKKFEVIFFDVGQGDAALINLPGNNEIIVDGGPDKSLLYKLGKYLPFYDRTIELVVLSHPHTDHCLGLAELFKRYRVKNIILTQINYNAPAYLALLQEIKQQKTKIIDPSTINSMRLTPDISLEIFYPWQDLKNTSLTNINQSSIVFKLNTPQKDFLFTGDINTQTEKMILKKNNSAQLKTDVLKIAHQGSDTSTSHEFLTFTQPKWAVISVGKNKFGHPSLRVIRRLERLGIRVLRTDQQGDIVFKIKNLP